MNKKTPLGKCFFRARYRPLANRAAVHRTEADSQRHIVACLNAARSVAQTYLRQKLGHVFLLFDVLGAKFGLPDLSSWENIQLFMENSNPTSKILDFRT